MGKQGTFCSVNEMKRPEQLHVCTFERSICMCALEALLIVLIHNGMLAQLIACLGMTCFIPSVHDVEHTVPATGDVCVVYVVCITTC